jgi:hypothetical protein
MDDKELNALIDAWAAYYDNPTGPDRDKYRQATIEVMSWAATKPDLLWRFITIAYNRELSENAIDNLAAGPLDDLIEYAGSEYKDIIEDLAIRDERFSSLVERCLAEAE